MLRPRLSAVCAQMPATVDGDGHLVEICAYGATVVTGADVVSVGDVVSVVSSDPDTNTTMRKTTAMRAITAPSITPKPMPPPLWLTWTAGFAGSFQLA